MQNRAPIDELQRDVQSPQPEDTPQHQSQPKISTDISPSDPGLDLSLDHALKHDHPEAPPAKKRRVVSSSERSTPRPPSPPWKRVGIDGPSSFVENGRRRSTRTNSIPLELQPPSEKRHTRGAQKVSGGKSKLNQTQNNDVAHSRFLVSKLETNGTRTLGGSNSKNGFETNASRSPVAKMSALKQTTSQAVNRRRPSDSIRSAASNDADKPTKPSPVRRVGRPPRRENDQFGTAVNLGNDDLGHKPHNLDASTNQRLPRLRFRVNMPSLNIQNPSHVLPPRQYPSFREWVDHEGTYDEEPYFATASDALQEARIRQRLRRAGEPNQTLSRERCSYYLTDPDEEPTRQYSHQDHLVAHVLYFKKLLDKERKHHRHLAKLFAQWCADAWRKRNKDPEELLKVQQDEIRRKHRQLVKDLQRQFELVRLEVDNARLARWEQQRKAEDQLALNNAIKKSTMLFERRKLDRPDNDVEYESELGDDSDAGDDRSSDNSMQSDNEDNISSSDLGSEDEDGSNDDNDDDDDENLSPEALRAKYAHLTATKETSPTSTHDGEHDLDSIANVVKTRIGSPEIFLNGDETPVYSKVEDVDPALLDDSDDSTDMEDDMGDSDSGTSDESDRASSNEEDNDDDNGGDEQSAGLLGFFSRKELAAPTGKDDDENSQSSSHHSTPKTPNGEIANAEGQAGAVYHEDNVDDEIDMEEVHLVTPTPKKLLDSGKPLPTDSRLVTVTNNSETDGLIHQIVENSVAEPISSQKTETAIHEALHTPTIDPHPSTPDTDTAKPPSEVADEEILEKPQSDIKTPIPHLLRGTLREYQHFGLDWLAGLYTSNINGILADEMGLGKTIQTIALLAHLAVEHEVWGPHLVIVPTSVMLNWEMEFKKWCPGFKILTYYGTQEERKQKRKGWMDDDRWHVCITSYQLVLQDQQVFRRRNWHYMVLDEAHNIKNFRSQRWQTLLTFKTQARLLLTGTPLQNNLTELWSLLFFLMPSNEGNDGIEGFADLRNFSEWFRRPVEQILEHGRDTMDDEAKRVVTKLHTVLRPYILRRLKVDVEKQMPAKYEHVITCRLSKRQRYLYDGFMSRAQTKETLASGNYLSIINCLMQLRKVCNHPDLFETRPITTSFAMPRSVIADFEIKDLILRRRLLHEDPIGQLDLDFLNLAPISREDNEKILVDDCTKIMAYDPLNALRERQYNRTNWQMDFDGSTIQSTLMSLDNSSRKSRMAELERCLYFESKRHGRRPIFGKGLIDMLTLDTTIKPSTSRMPPRKARINWLSNQSTVLESIILSIEEKSRVMEPYIQKFACITPTAIAHGVTAAALTPIQSRYFKPYQRVPEYDPFHEAQMRLSIAFPDKRLLQYDCGKLQQLDKLLRRLQTGGHRALIFTQMTKMLDILEQFLNIHGHRYLRLDGATKIEQRQLLTERFNNDPRILAFILSSRSGGLGINLTGADTVIFYDLDWNPAMDKQCQDRCHRIGQTRDVHIYRFVSEYTIESNILRKANQKRMLDDVVIQEGEFTTDYLNKLHVRDIIDEDGNGLTEGHDEASAAMDRVLDTKVRGAARVFEQAEDKEDIDAAKTAEKELEHVDDADFEEGTTPHTPGAGQVLGQSQTGTPLPTEYDPSISQTNNNTRHVTPSVAVLDGGLDSTYDDSEAQVGHVDDYLLRFMEWNLESQPLILPAGKNKKTKRGREHRVRRKR
ncbi:swr1 complex component [Myotisia sp. PD_48]|nr:swr1 complex component [Myotisia sp. PD_48]